MSVERPSEPRRDAPEGRQPQQPATLRDVAEVAGVHATTASRALNPKAQQLVNAETVRRVMRAAEELGYQPNPIARSLKTSKSSTVGLVIPDLTNPLFPPIVRGIENVLESAGYSALIVNTDNDPQRERALIESLRSRQVEGLIIATALLDHPLLQRLQEQDVKIVLINRRIENLRMPFVVGDDATGIALAVKHLVDLGHTRIAHIAGPQTTSTGVVRSRAFRHAIRDYGVVDDPALIVECAHWSEGDGASSMRELLDRGTGCTAVVAGNDLIALGCYDVFAERGISCPQDISVVGFNDMPFLDKLRPPLTTVGVPHHELGAEAARMLLDCIEEPQRHPRSLLLSVSLVLRDSTAAPRA
ncbi:LacI family DNA-binding transcriptional regulator [Actinomadura sp. HBU206391]|uniref:LacI family DNA-binding transcriptional regulator n=1 Tax=Actinomadura sp. HBU206391 TaxID=2731692 RepID=UPI00164FB192|nr:LacI family DNA-binding transcriptional regulator [Actinomadura sp. HBU206391]MBC6461140.1 LacI family DNA-binding transcriptional regulator [Actinomadura sp. HBU206391]